MNQLLAFHLKLLSIDRINDKIMLELLREIPFPYQQESIFKMLQELKQDGYFGLMIRNLSIRKSDLDDVRHERYQRIALVVTSLVLGARMKSFEPIQDTEEAALEKSNELLQVYEKATEQYKRAQKLMQRLQIEEQRERTREKGNLGISSRIQCQVWRFVCISRASKTKAIYDRRTGYSPHQFMEGMDSMEKRTWCH
jgi:hypothetical protein